MVKCQLALIFTSLSIVGCSGFTEFAYRHSQKERAQDAWKVAGTPGATTDYKDGWQTGYYDLAMGSDGQVPPVPPKKYWSDKYQNPDGQQCITDWYAGYQDGVIAAEHVGEFEWQLVPSSGIAALPSALFDDYPTSYSSQPTAEDELPEPLSSEPPATAEARRLSRPPQQAGNDAVAVTAQPPFDLRALTGRPAAPPSMSHPAYQHAEVASSDVRNFAPVPSIIPEARLVLGWPAWTDAPRPTTSPAPPAESELQREQIVSRQPTSAVPSREAIVRKAEPFLVDPIDSPSKPIVIVARPLQLPESSSTQR